MFTGENTEPGKRATTLANALMQIRSIASIDSKSVAEHYFNSTTKGKMLNIPSSTIRYITMISKSLKSSWTSQQAIVVRGSLQRSGTTRS